MSSVGVKGKVVVCSLGLTLCATLVCNAQATNHQPADGQAAEQADQQAPAPAAPVLGPQVLEQANALLLAEDAEGAIALLRDYAPQNPTMRAFKRNTLAAAYVDMEDWESALAQYVGVVEAPGGLPPNMVASASMGAIVSCMKLGRYEDAVTHFEAWKRIAVEPQAGLHFEISRAYKELGQYTLAIENLEVALRLAEEKAGTSDEDPNMVMYFRNQLAELQRLAGGQ